MSSGVTVVVHGGLHKSATTSVQLAWRRAYARNGPVMYPSRTRRRSPGHQYLVWPLLDAFSHASDLAAARGRRALDPEALRRTIDECVASGATTIVLSSEELDRLRPDDVPRFATALDGADVTWLITATRPAHRWCAGWQELVKHGLSNHPTEAADQVLAFSALQVGDLSGLVGLVGQLAERRIIRLVRTDPAEPDLARELARLTGLPDPGESTELRNRSLGRDVAVLRQLNHEGLTSGLDAQARGMLRELRTTGLTRIDEPTLEGRYALPDEWTVAARAEAAFLESPGAGVQVLDPHALLPGWTEPSPPDWYAEVSRTRVVLPD